LKKEVQQLRQRVEVAKSDNDREKFRDIWQSATKMLQGLPCGHPLCVPTNFFVNESRQRVIDAVQTWTFRALRRDQLGNRTSRAVGGPKGSGKTELLKYLASLQTVVAKDVFVSFLCDAHTNSEGDGACLHGDVLRTLRSFLNRRVIPYSAGKSDIDVHIRELNLQGIFPTLYSDEVQQLINNPTSKSIEAWVELRTIGNSVSALGIISGSSSQIGSMLYNSQQFDYRFDPLNWTKFRFEPQQLISTHPILEG
jgi:hypothetical protein